jgi:hypothetical protein
MVLTHKNSGSSLLVPTWLISEDRHLLLAFIAGAAASKEGYTSPNLRKWSFE